MSKRCLQKYGSCPGILPILKKISFSLILLFSLLFVSADTYAQNRTVTGTVKNEKGEPLEGITVSVKGTPVATSTNATGDFSIQIPEGRKILAFSGVGYKSTETSISGQQTVNVQMQINVTEGEAVVVVAYGGTQKKATLSGSIATIKGEEILKSPAINVSNSLAGRVPGLTVVAQGGEPGNDFSTILVRGINTFKNATPLFVVDGVPLQGSDKLQRIDPASIESITVLKDASAAIYGSQGANGVILVTTKRGKAGKVAVSATFNQGFSQPTKLPDLLGSYEIAVLQNEGLDADPNFPTPSWHTGKYSVYELAGFLRDNDPWRYSNTNWIKETLKDWATQNYANVTVSGGSEKIRGLISFASRYQDGFVKNGSGKYHQYDIRGNIDFNPTKYILLSVDVNGRQDRPDFPISDAGRIFYQTTTAPPGRRAYWPDGSLGQSTDPTGQSGSPAAIGTSLGGYNRGENYVFNSTAKLNIKTPWVEGLSFTATGTFDRSFNFGKYWTIPVIYNDGWDSTSGTTNPVFIKSTQGDLIRTLIQSEGRSKNYLFNFLVNYEKKIGAHQIKILGGYEQYERYSSFYYIKRTNFDADNLDQLQFGKPGTEAIVQNSPGATRWRNYLGRLNYDFRSKIFAEFVFRYQGSSIFRKEDRWGFFPGGSLAYRISEEDFWKDNISFINSFKIRASYGETGNDLVAPFQYLSLFRPGDNPNYVEQIGPNGAITHTSTLQESVVPNPGVTWEKAKQLDIGFDAELLNGKLNITADYFKNKRTDILTPPNGAIPASTGLTPSDINIGRFLNRGFDFNILFKNNAGQLRYNIGVNGLYAKNKVLFFDEVAGRPLYQQQTGHPINSGSYYHVLGIYRAAKDITDHPVGRGGALPVLGDLIFEDVNGDGAIDDRDLVRSDKSSIPTFSGGLTAGFQYKNFDLSILFQGAFGAERYLRPTFSLGGNYLQAFYDKRWTEDNPNAGFPRVHSGGSAYWSDPNGVFNTFFVRKTDYVRLKTVELGYNLPKSLIQRFKIENIRIYVSGLNLITIAPDLKDFDTDPEEIVRDQFYGESYPLQRIINFGINVNF
jgi:TonB-dependent starch-binding outer membrane protein SusC